MSPEQPDLANLQRWMQEVVVHQGTIEDAVASPAAESEVPADRLGDHLPLFLVDRPDWSQGGFLTDLARPELAMTEVFDELQSPVISGKDIEAAPPETWETARLEPVAALRLLSLEHVVVPHP